MKRAVVIGGGIAGITAALLLRRRGCEVALAEKAPQLAMTLRGFTRKGCYFDTGLHLSGGLGENGPLRAFFRLLELDLPPLLPFNPESYLRIVFGESGRKADIPVGRAAFTVSLARQFPGGESALAAYVRDSCAIWRSSPFLDSAQDIGAAFNAEYDARPLASYLARLTDMPELRSVLAAHCLLYGVPPEETPLTQHVLVAASCFDSVHTFQGGGAALVRALEAKLREQGVRVMRGNGARSVELDGAGRVAALVLESGERIPADAVVFTAHPALLCDLFPQGVFKPSYVRRLAELVDTPSASILFGTSEEPVRELSGRNLVICPETDLASAFAPGRPPRLGPFYIAECPQNAPCAKQAFVIVAPDSLFRYAAWSESRSGARPGGYAERKAATLEEIKKAVADHIPAFGRAEIVDGASPLTLRDYLNTPGGSLYACRHSIRQFNPQPVTRVPGLWLAGQSIVAPGILGAVLSAFLACGLMTDLAELLKELRTCR